MTSSHKTKVGFDWRILDVPDGVGRDYMPPRGWRLPSVGEGMTLLDEGVIHSSLWFWCESVRLKQRVGVGFYVDSLDAYVSFDVGRARRVVLIKKEKKGRQAL